MEITNIENCNYVMFPRLQRPGLKPQHVERDLFKAEYKVRSTSPFERDYLLGKYGATPLIGDMESIFNPSKLS